MKEPTSVEREESREEPDAVSDERPVAGLDGASVTPDARGPSDGTGQPAPPPGPAPEVVVSHHGGGGNRRWIKILIWIFVLALVAAAGWFVYDKYLRKAPAKVATNKDTNVRLLKVGVQGADYGKLYPDISTSEYAYLANSQMFEGLVRYENKNKVVPALATDWKNPDGMTWVFTIKKGVKFHDGHTLTAKDVKYSLDKIVNSDTGFSETFASTIASVETIGDDQVKITTTDPDPTLLNKLTFLYIIDDDPPAGAGPSDAGTGPYKIKPGTEATTLSLRMVAFDDYHGGRPSTRELVLGSEETSASLLKAFKEGRYDIVGSLSPEDADKFGSAARFISSQPDVNFIAFNTVKPGPLQKKEVREAIRYAIDPNAIGEARNAYTTPLSQLIPPSIPGYNPAIRPYKQDIGKAKQLLAQAGYSEGLKLKLSLSDISKNGQLTQEIVNELKKAGITVIPDQHDDFSEFIDYFTSGKAEMYTVDYSSDTLDGLDIYTTTISDTNYDNPDLTALLDEAGNETEPAKRLKLLQDAAVVIDKDVPVVPMSTENNLWLMDKDYVIEQDMPSSFISVYFYKVRLK
ncbi:MAG TPA: ABC transporter substrate-binding protein [Candidatus Saccharimonadales bacterium]|nr:ABC transporter substrate-binding protein [Candidatus Saccharimonadales bacterium]